MEAGVSPLKTASICAFTLCAVAATQSTVAQGLDVLPPVLEALRPLDAPALIGSAADVRWQSDGSLQVGLRQDGVYVWRPGAGGSELLATLAGTTYRRAGRYGNYSRLGGGPAGSVVFAGDLFGVYRQQHDGRVTALKTNLEIVGDLDEHNGWTVAVGLSRQAEPTPGPDDIWEPHIAWMFDTEGGVQGLLPTRDGGAALDACYPVELSLARFVADDLALVIPGAEPGAFLYGKDGLLRGTVDVGTFSASRPDCGPQQKPLLYKEEFRHAWLNRHRVIDEVAANDEGDVFFFVRHVEERGSVGVTARSTGIGRPAVGQRGDVDRTDAVEAGEHTPTALALGLDSLPAGELEALLKEAASEGGLIVLDGDRAARVVAAAKAQTARREGSRPSGSPVFPAASVRVCWDLVHARVQDLSGVSTAACAVKSDMPDARLRVDLSGDRAVLLVRGATRLASGGVTRPAPSEFFEARLRAGS